MQPGGFHVTLAFLGNQDANRVPDVASALDRAVSEGASFTLRPAALGSFGRRGLIEVVWAGVRDEPQHSLFNLRGRLVAELRSGRIPFDQTPFRPHVTLGRARRSPDREATTALVAALAAHAIWAEAPAAVTEITLFQSDLRPNGAFYTPLHRAHLAPSAN